MIGDLTQRPIHPSPAEQDNNNSLFELAKCVHKKTLGNPFYTLQLLEMLQRKKMIFYNIHSYRWEWVNLDLIVESIGLADNVVDLVVAKLDTLDEDLQQIMRIAACLGQKFNRKDVEQVLLRRKS